MEREERGECQQKGENEAKRKEKIVKNIKLI